MTKVLIVEDDPMARRLLEIFVNGSERYTVVQAIDNASMAELFCLKNHIDLILMDVCTAMNASGLDAAAKIKKTFPEIKIIIVTSQPECSFIERARSIGVDSFWYKESTAEKVVDIMDRTMNGESVYPDGTPELRLGNALSVDFTDKEIEVLRELIGGDPDAVIAETLNVSLRTVKAHIQNMREKTGFRNRTELAVRARGCGFIINEFKNE